MKLTKKQLEVFEMYDPNQFYEIWDGLMKGLDITLYADPDFSGSQMREIRQGLNMCRVLDKALDVAIYAKPHFDSEQMKIIRLGLIKKLDVKAYTDPKYSAEQMIKILEKMEEADRKGEYYDVHNNI